MMATRLLALCLLAACSVKHVPAPPHSPSERRAAVVMRDVRWIHDTIPILRFEPYFIYFAWKAEMESCSGVKREGMPVFYVAPISPLAGDGRIGFYAPDSRSVVLSLGYERDAWIVRHEILHYLLEPVIPKARPGEPPEETAIRAHPPEFFERRCGPLVKQS